MNETVGEEILFFLTQCDTEYGMGIFIECLRFGIGVTHGDIDIKFVNIPGETALFDMVDQVGAKCFDSACFKFFRICQNGIFTVGDVINTMFWQQGTELFECIEEDCVQLFGNIAAEKALIEGIVIHINQKKTRFSHLKMVDIFHKCQFIRITTCSVD